MLWSLSGTDVLGGVTLLLLNLKVSLVKCLHVCRVCPNLLKMLYFDFLGNAWNAHVKSGSIAWRRTPIYTMNRVEKHLVVRYVCMCMHYVCMHNLCMKQASRTKWYPVFVMLFSLVPACIVSADLHIIHWHFCMTSKL